jgi:hypothetical protein
MKRDEERPRHLPSEEVEELKPDLPTKSRNPADLIRMERDTYGDDSTFPNRDDTEDEHEGDK